MAKLKSIVIVSTVAIALAVSAAHAQNFGGNDVIHQDSFSGNTVIEHYNPNGSFGGRSEIHQPALPGLPAIVDHYGPNGGSQGRTTITQAPQSP